MTGINVRHIVRLFSKDPAFALTVIAIMALSIGSCTAVFSLVKAVMLTPLPYKEADRLAIVWHTNGNSPEVSPVWAREYHTYRDTTRSFQSVAAFSAAGYNLSNGGEPSREPSRITCSRLTANVFPMLGITSLRGRWFAAEEDRYGANPVIVLSHDLWRARFGSDEAVIGKTVRLDLKPYTVIGVMPESFVFPPQGMRVASKSECWIPASISPMEMAMPGFNWIVFGNLKPGITLSQAQQDASEVAKGILDSYPAAVQKEVALRARVVSMHEEVRGRNRTPMLVFAGSVGFLLLIGCANIANLILGKLHLRQREIAVRAAMGATGGVLTAQLLIESVALAASGGLLGVPVAFGVLRVLVSLAPGRVPEGIHTDAVALIFAGVCSVVSGILAGLAPALRARRIDVAAGMAEGSRGSAGGIRHNRLRSVLAVSEIAMALVLLIGAGLLLRSFQKLANVSPGFDSENVLTFSVALPEQSYKEPAQVNRLVDSVLQQMRGFRNITFVSAATSLPLGPAEGTVFSRLGAPPATAGFKPAVIKIVTPEYLQAFRIDVKRGRSIETGDDASRMPVALVNEAMAAKYWPDTDAIGKQLFWLVGGRNLTIAGIVEDVLQEGLGEAATPAFYVPLAQSPQPQRSLVFAIRTDGPAPGLSEQVRRVVREADASLPVFAIQSAKEVVSNSIGNERFNMFVVSVLAALALAVSVIGLYAVVSYLVVHSWTELGVRMALGATRQRILWMVVAKGAKFISSGMAVGLVGALMLTRFMKTMLFGITETDSVTFAAVVLVLSGVALVAVLVPAIRAGRVDPAVTLR